LSRGRLFFRFYMSLSVFELKAGPPVLVMRSGFPDDLRNGT
jgi:hypothetical protein